MCPCFACVLILPLSFLLIWLRKKLFHKDSLEGSNVIVSPVKIDLENDIISYRDLFKIRPLDNWRLARNWTLSSHRSCKTRGKVYCNFCEKHCTISTFNITHY